MVVKSTNRSRNDSDLPLTLPHNPEAVGSSPASATRRNSEIADLGILLFAQGVQTKKAVRSLTGRLFVMRFSGGLLSARKVKDKADGRADECRADPAEAELGKRQIRRTERLDGVAVDGVVDARGQRDDEVVDRGDEREAHRPAVHRAVMAEELAEQCQRDERDGERIEEHQHRQGVGDDGIEAEVCKQERDEAEDDRPGAVLRALGEKGGEGLGTARDETDGGFEAGERHGGSQDEKARRAEIVLRDLRERRAAVFGGFEHAAALRTGKGHGNVDERHEKAAEDARADGAARHGGGLFHAEIADDLHHDDAEGETRQRVHGVVAFKEACEEGLVGVAAERRHLRNRDARRSEHHHHEDGEKDEEAGREDLADPGEDLARAQREEERRGEERHREEKKVDRGVSVLRQHLLKTHGEGGRGAAGNGKERPDGQIQRAGEKHRIGAADLAAEVEKSRRAADAERGHAEQRQAHACDEKAEDSEPDIRAGHLAEVHGEDEVAGAEKEAEQHAGNIGVFFCREFTFHNIFPFAAAEGRKNASAQMIRVTKKPAAPYHPTISGYYSPACGQCRRRVCRINGTYRI